MHPISKLTWSKLKDMPVPMVLPQSVVIHGNVYMYAIYGDLFSDSGDIYKYNPNAQRWTKLEPYHCWFCTMTEVNHKITMVGGVDGNTSKASNAVAAYSTSQEWVQCCSQMTTPHIYPAVFTYDQYLVVAGGCDGAHTNLATVEILKMSTEHSQWFSTIPL